MAHPSSRPNVIAAAVMVVSGALVAVSQHQIRRSFEWKYPPLNELVVMDSFQGDLGMLLAGSHRMAADVAYIQFLQYYGHPPVDVAEEEHEHHSVEDERLHDFTRLGRYPLMKSFVSRIIGLDPFFNTAILEGIGALAFNQRREDEALEMLELAIRRDSSFYRYHLYVSAILYKKKGEDQKLIGLLQEATQYPDCPPMVTLVLGNLLAKYNRGEEAVRVYLKVALNAPSPTDRQDAVGRLQRLLRQKPELRTLPELQNLPTTP